MSTNYHGNPFGEDSESPFSVSIDSVFCESPFSVSIL